MTPKCYNRPPFDMGRWELVGFRDVGNGRKPHYRWRQSWFEDRCTQHDGRGIGPNNESYAKAHGFACAGCRWEPAKVRQAREFEERMRAGPVDKAVDKGMVIHISTPSGTQPMYEELKRGADAALAAGFVPIPFWTNGGADDRVRRAWGHDLIVAAVGPIERGLADSHRRMAELAASVMSAVKLSATPDDRL